jgi:hypothetical protein
MRYYMRSISIVSNLDQNRHIAKCSKIDFDAIGLNADLGIGISIQTRQAQNDVFVISVLINTATNNSNYTKAIHRISGVSVTMLLRIQINCLYDFQLNSLC